MDGGPATQAMLETGLVDEAFLQQLRKWGLLTEDTPPVDQGLSAERVVSRIQEALEGPEAVHIRDTDLDAVSRFLNEKQGGKLHLPVPEDDTKTTSVPIEFYITKFGEYLLPWKSEGIQTLLTDRRTYLKQANKPRVYFDDVRELFYGGKKAFVVCAPRG